MADDLTPMELRALCKSIILDNLFKTDAIIRTLFPYTTVTSVPDHKLREVYNALLIAVQ